VKDIEEQYVKQGKTTFVHTVKMPVRDEKGTIVGVLGIFWDITDQKKTADALRESEEKYRLVSENIPVTVYSALPDEYSTSIFVSERLVPRNTWFCGPRHCEEAEGRRGNLPALEGRGCSGTEVPHDDAHSFDCYGVLEYSQRLPQSTQMFSLPTRATDSDNFCSQIGETNPL
jgi:hypothetical protein